jgi:uncharacterized protein (TIGR04141 family)
VSETDLEISQISFYLGKQNTEFRDIVETETDLGSRKEYFKRAFELEGYPCELHYFESEIRRTNPKWLDFLNAQIPDDKQIVFSAMSRSPNALFLVKFEERVLATSFGRSATTYLKKDSLENDFGIRTAMNMCGNEEIRQTKSQSNSIAITHIDRQMSRPSDTFVFGLSEAEDLKYISANMKGNALITLQGRDRLTFKGLGTEKLSWDKLLNRCQEFLNAYEKDDFKDLFPNYRNFTPATMEQVELLDAKLIDALKAKEFDKLQICIPEFIADDEYSFAYSNKPKQPNDIYSHLDVAQINDHIKTKNLSPKILKNRDIFAYSHAEDKILNYKKWSLYNCLIFEADLNGTPFILSDGQWAAVEKEFFDEIEHFVQNQLTTADCPDNCKNIAINDDTDKKNKEEIFNNTACELNDDWVKFDRAQLKIGKGRSDKEFCDILSMDEDAVSIIHCKPLKNASSINYLFSQAKFYGDAFLQDQVFLDDIRNFISKSKCTRKADYLAHINDKVEDIYAQNYRIRLWLLHDTKQPKTANDLPFIAKYELMLMHDHLKRICKFREIVLSFIPVKTVNYKTRNRLAIAHK